MKKNYLSQQTPSEIGLNIVKNIKAKRRKLNISQQTLASKSGVSFGSIKRFETQYEIALSSLIRIAIVLECESELISLFSSKNKLSLEDYLE